MATMLAAAAHRGGAGGAGVRVSLDGDDERDAFITSQQMYAARLDKGEGSGEELDASLAWYTVVPIRHC